MIPKIKIVSKKQALWTIVKDNLKREIEETESNLKVKKAFLKLAKEKIK